MFHVRFTPLHPNGYPRFAKDKRKELTEPFLQRNHCGGPYARYATRQEAEQAVGDYQQLTRGTELSVYSLRAEVVER